MLSTPSPREDHMGPISNTPLRKAHDWEGMVKPKACGHVTLRPQNLPLGGKGKADRLGDVQPREAQNVLEFPLCPKPLYPTLTLASGTETG